MADVLKSLGFANLATEYWHWSPMVIVTGLVTVGDPGNKPDSKTGSGAIDYTFEIGKFAVKASEYCAFLNVVTTKADPYELYSSYMGSDTRVNSIPQTWNSKNKGYSYSVISGREDFPIVYVNWLENNQAERPEGPMTTERGSYTLNGSPNSFPSSLMYKSYNKQFLVNSGAHWRLPSSDEWYKATYYKGGGIDAGYWLYPTQSDITPGNEIGDKPNQANHDAFGHYSTSHTWMSDYSYYLGDGKPYLTKVGAFSGSPGPYGTYDMGGNVWQWNDSFAVENISTAEGLASQGAHGIGGGAWASTSGEYRLRGTFHELNAERDGLDATKFNSFKFYQMFGDACVGFRVVHVIDEVDTSGAEVLS